VLYREVVTVCSEIHTKQNQKNHFVGRTCNFFNFKRGGRNNNNRGFEWLVKKLTTVTLADAREGEHSRQFGLHHDG